MEEFFSINIFHIYKTLYLSVSRSQRQHKSFKTIPFYIWMISDTQIILWMSISIIASRYSKSIIDCWTLNLSKDTWSFDVHSKLSSQMDVKNVVCLQRLHHMGLVYFSWHVSSSLPVFMFISLTFVVNTVLVLMCVLM